MIFLFIFITTVKPNSSYTSSSWWEG